MNAFVKKHLANALTLSRLLAVIPLLLLLYSAWPNRFFAAVILFGAVIPTDALDGYIARKWQQTSELGKFLDPLCDKTLMYVLLFALFDFDVYVPYVIFPMFLRDILVDGLRNYMAKQDRVIPANFSGKTKFVLQTVSIFAGLLHLHSGPHAASEYRMLANITLAVAFLISLVGLPILYQNARGHPVSAE
jgi:CDP-diacylglycerol--glycerol-3-phosphate 3-phosphatidyltransferase